MSRCYGASCPGLVSASAAWAAVVVAVVLRSSEKTPPVGNHPDVQHLGGVGVLPGGRVALSAQRDVEPGDDDPVSPADLHVRVPAGQPAADLRPVRVAPIRYIAPSRIGAWPLIPALGAHPGGLPQHDPAVML